MKRLLCKVFGHRWVYDCCVFMAGAGECYVGPADRCERCGDYRPARRGRGV